MKSSAYDSWVVSTLLGHATHFSNSPIRQICVRPFSHGWYRFTSVLSKVYGQDMLYLQSFMEGITFGTSRYDSPGQAVSGKRSKNHAAPIQGSIIKASEQSTYWSASCFPVLTKDQSLFTMDVRNSSSAIIGTDRTKETLKKARRLCYSSR